MISVPLVPLLGGPLMNPFGPGQLGPMHGLTMGPIMPAVAPMMMLRPPVPIIGGGNKILVNPKFQGIPQPQPAGQLLSLRRMNSGVTTVRLRIDGVPQQQMLPPRPAMPGPPMMHANAIPG